MAHTCVWCNQTAGITRRARNIRNGTEIVLYFCNSPCAEAFFKNAKNATVLIEVKDGDPPAAVTKSARNRRQ